MGSIQILTKTKCCNNDDCENVDTDDDDKPTQIINPMPILSDNKKEELINLDNSEESFTTTIPYISPRN